MPAVEIRVPNAKTLPDLMGRMREWLDRRQFVPSCCRFDETRLLIRIEFSNAAEATAFTKVFDGIIIEPIRSASLYGRRVGEQPTPWAPKP